VARLTILPWRLGAGLGSVQHSPSQHEPSQVLVPQHSHIVVTGPGSQLPDCQLARDRGRQPCCER